MSFLPLEGCDIYAGLEEGKARALRGRNRMRNEPERELKEQNKRSALALRNYRYLW